MATTALNFDPSDVESADSDAKHRAPADTTGGRRKISDWPLKRQIALQIGLTLILFAAITWFFTLDIKTQLVEARTNTMRSVVSVATSVAQQYQTRAANGELSPTEARERAVDTLSGLRFGPDNNNYVFVVDDTTDVVVHPTLSRGKNMSDYTDSNGNAFFQGLVDIGREQQAGSLGYVFPKAGGRQEIDKVSYVKRFAPWGWNIAAGSYLDDIDDAFYAQLFRFALVFFVAAALLSTGLIWLARRIYRALGGEIYTANTQVGYVAAGDLTHAAPADRAHGQHLMGRIEAMRQELARTIGDIRSSSESIETATAEIADGNSDLSSRTQQQAASLEETAASMNELTSTVGQTAENAQHARHIADESGHSLTHSRQAIESVVETMQEIRRGAGEISTITALIDDIAFRTNLLALNASVEAARAGEHGRGFSVVATEVRQLARNSAEAAEQIKGLVEQSVAQADGGTRQVDNAQQAMQDLSGHVEQTRTLVGEISAATTEQSSGIEQVNQAVAQMDGVTQQNAALVEQAAAASQSLRDQANTLYQLVGRFKIVL